MTEQDEKSPRDLSDEELHDPAAWDFDNAEQLPAPERKARAVVSVAFSSDALEFVNAAALDAEMKLSQFIREAAMEKAAAATLTLHLDAPLTETKNFGSAILHSEEMAVSA